MPDTFQALNRLQSLRADIDVRLRAYFATLSDSLGIAVSPNGRLALERLEEFALRPGKRIRGALAIVGYEMFGGSNRAAALDLAVAVELMQDYLLIVDDVMDRSQQRRGGPTVHAYYYERFVEQFPGEDNAHLSNMLSINVGLLAQHLAARLLSEIDEAPEHIIRAGSVFQANLAATGFGQIDDLMNEAGQPTTLQATRQMYMLKSSYYTFVNPLQSGAALAGASADQLEPLKEFGLHAGVAFQLQDDIIGMFGNEKETGKSNLDDLREGKMTFLMRHALEHATGAQGQVMHQALGNKDLTVEQHRAAMQVLEGLGSRGYVQAEARQETDEALRMLQAQQDWPAEGVAFLTDLLEYVISRQN